MFMDIGERKGILRAFLGIKADGYALADSDIIHSRVLLEERVRDGRRILVKLYRCNGCRDLLNQTKVFVPV